MESSSTQHRNSGHKLCRPCCSAMAAWKGGDRLVCTRSTNGSSTCRRCYYMGKNCLPAEGPLRLAGSTLLRVLEQNPGPPNAFVKSAQAFVSKTLEDQTERRNLAADPDSRAQKDDYRSIVKDVFAEISDIGVTLKTMSAHIDRYVEWTITGKDIQQPDD